MVRHIAVFLTVLCSIVAGTCSAQAERRLALLIGINEYDHLPRLQKAVGDVDAMERKLKGLGFDVTKVINPDRRTFNIALGRFAARLGPGNLAFLHFSGHGVEIDGDNFLLPRDIPKPESGQRDTVKYEAIGLRRLISQLTSTGARARVFVIDACRDNPFEQSGVRSIGSSRGLARVEAPAGNFIMYSAGYRQRALDTLGPDDTEETSVYTRVLLNKLDRPGATLASIARDVRKEVQTMSQNIGHVQRPAYYDELSSPLVLRPGVEEQKPVSTAVTPPAQVIQSLAPPVPTANDKQIELLYWNEVRDSKDIAALQSYVTQYPTGSFAPLAKIRIAKLRKEKRRKQAAQKQKVAALTNTDTVIPTDDNRAIAVVPTDEPEVTPAPVAVSTPAVPELNVRDIVLGVQKQLLRLGCNPGRPDGAWGPRSRRALQSYARHRKVRLAALEPTQELLKELNELNARVCPIQCGPRHTLSKGRCVRKTCGRGEVLTSRGRCVVRAERTRVKKKRERVRTKRRARVERRRKPRGQARIRVLGDPSLSVGVRRPSRKRRICADRERALCEWDH
ncbi:MAG: caspase family protein [Pseudomonadota bacterium]